jgi:hypothetical protein
MRSSIKWYRDENKAPWAGQSKDASLKIALRYSPRLFLVLRSRFFSIIADFVCLTTNLFSQFGWFLVRFFLFLKRNMIGLA